MTNKEIEMLKFLLKRAVEQAWTSHWKAFYKKKDIIESDCTSEFYKEIQHLRITILNPSYEEYLKEEEE